MSEAIPEMEIMAKQWYNTDAVAFELINTMKFRESIFIATNRRKPIRCLKINAVRFLYKNFDKFQFFGDENLYNIYSSVAHFPDFPMFSWNYEEKQEQQSKFNANFMDYVKGYDFFVDLDNPNPELVHASSTRLKNIYDDYKIMYSLPYSGTKGFHFNVNYENFPEKLKNIPFDKLANLFKLFAYELKLMEKVRDIDTSIFDLRRIRKTPYSVTYPYYRVALPLSDEQFENFSLKEVFLPNLIEDTQSIRKRGLLTRKGKPEALLELMRDLANKRKKTEPLFRLFKTRKQTLYGAMQEVGLIG